MIYSGRFRGNGLARDRALRDSRTTPAGPTQDRPHVSLNMTEAAVKSSRSLAECWRRNAKARSRLITSPDPRRLDRPVPFFAALMPVASPARTSWLTVGWPIVFSDSRMRVQSPTVPEVARR